MLTPQLSVIIPASDEEAYIGPCLTALFASAPMDSGAEVIVVANGCRDATVASARRHAEMADRSGWRLTVLDLEHGSKPGALNAGEAAASGALRVYLDADVVVSPPLMAQIVAELSRQAPIFVGATPRIPRARSAVTRAYARFWQRLPFARSIAPGYGLFATNAAGRSRWGSFPDIISDDTFVRLHFAPLERVQVPALYDWPMIEGFAALTRVRRRQNAGVAEIEARYPELMAGAAKPRPGNAGLARLAMSDPVGFAFYAAITLAVHCGRKSAGWTRGR